MDSVREQVVQAFVEALNASATRPATAYRTRTEPLQPENLPAYLVRIKHEARTREGPTISLSKLTIRIECVTVGAPPQDTALDPLLVYAVKTFYDNTSPFSALVTGGEDPTIEWDVENSYEDLAVAALDVVAVFKTNTFDPTVLVTP